jgi:hypothetical protein
MTADPDGLAAYEAMLATLRTQVREPTRSWREILETARETVRPKRTEEQRP